MHRIIVILGFLTVLAATFSKIASATIQPSGSIPALSTDHTLSESGRLAAIDLDHGAGADRLLLQRVWFGRDTLNTQFGFGWSDINQVRLTLTSSDTLIIWRGGVGWRTAIKQQESFVTDNNERIERTADGWVMRGEQGEEWNFDKDGRLLTERTAVGPPASYQYDDKGRLSAVILGPENTLRYHYTGDGRHVSEVKGPEGLSTSYGYDGSGRLVEVVNSRGIRMTYRYDDQGTLLTAEDQFGVKRHSEPLRGEESKSKDPSLAKKNGDLRMTIEEASISPEENYTLLSLPEPKIKKNPQGLPEQIDFLGQSISYVYDKTGHLRSVKSAQGETSYQYDAFGRISEIEFPDASTTRLQYNPLGLVTKVESSDGVTGSFIYDSFGRLTRNEMSDGTWEELVYDERSRVSVRKVSHAPESRYLYNKEDSLTGVDFSNGNFVRYTYDAAGRTTSETWNDGTSHQWNYDAAGRLIETRNPHGLKINLAYDESGQIIQVSDSVHGVTRFKRSENSLQIESDTLGSRSYESNALGLPLTMTSPSGGKTLFQYTKAFEPERVITPLGTSWGYRYDAMERLSEIVYPSGLVTRLERDNAGNISSIIRGDITWRRYLYDNLGRLSEETNGAGEALHYHYDANGKLLGVKAPERMDQIQYDPNGKWIKMTGPEYEITEQYATDGMLIARKYTQPGGSPILDLHLPRDSRGRFDGIELNGVKAQYEYSTNGEIKRILLPDHQGIEIERDQAGRPTQFKLGKALTLKLQYDSADRITEISAQQNVFKNLFRERYIYDMAGNLSQIEPDAQKLALSYDADNRLMTTTKNDERHNFSYDTDGNLTTSPSDDEFSRWALDALGRPQKLGELTYQWDAAGRLVKVQSPAGVIENRFTAGDLLSSRRVGDAQWRYGYLPNGDRLWQENAQGRIWYVYLPEGLVGFRDERSITWLLITLPGSDLPLALAGSDGRIFFAVTDRLNSVRRWVDEKGNVISSTDYGPFGAIEKKDDVNLPRFYAGLLRDAGGLYYARARYYDPHLARFISMDHELGNHELPISHNAYAYAANNPYRYRDAAGLAPAPIYPHDLRHLPTDMLEAIAAADEEQLARLMRGRRIAGSASDVRGTAMSIAAARARVQQEVMVEGWHVLNRAPVNPSASDPLIGRVMRVNSLALTQSTPALSVTRTSPALAVPRPPPTLAVPQQVAAAESAASGVARSRILSGAGAAAAESGAVGGTRILSGAGAAAESGALGGTRILPTAGEIAAGSRASHLRAAAAQIASETAGRRGILGSAGRLAGRLSGPWGMVATEAAHAAYEGGRATSATYENREAAFTAQQTLGHVRERFLSEENQHLLLPRPDGRRWDPGDPDQLQEMVNRVHSNLNNNRRVFDGLMAPYDQVPPEQMAAMRNAVRQCMLELQTARQLSIQISNEDDQLAQNNQKVRAQLQMANGYVQSLKGQLANAKEALSLARKLKSDLGAADKQLTGLQTAASAAPAIAQRARQCRQKVCGYASQSVIASEEQVEKWRKESETLVADTRAALQNLIGQLNRVPIDTDGLLRDASNLAAKNGDVGFIRGGGVGQVRPVAEAALASARKAAEETDRLEANIVEWLGELRNIPERVRLVMQPHLWSDETMPCMSGITDSFAVTLVGSAAQDYQGTIAFVEKQQKLFWNEAAAIEQSLKDLNIEELVAGVQTTTTAAAPLLRDIESLQLAQRAEDIQAAAQCINQIQIGARDIEGPMGGDKPEEPSEDLVTVPNLAALGDAAAMKGAVQGVGLEISFAAADQATPSQDQEFKLQKQAPDAGSKLRKGEWVTAFIYPKFGSQTAGETIAGAMPNLVNKTLDAAVDMLWAAGFEPGGVVSGLKPPDKDHAYLVSGTTPPAGTLISQNNKPYIEIRVYGPYEGPAQPTQPAQLIQQEQPPVQVTDEGSVYMQNAQGMSWEEECRTRRSFGMDCPRPGSLQGGSKDVVGNWSGPCTLTAVPLDKPGYYPPGTSIGKVQRADQIIVVEEGGRRSVKQMIAGGPQSQWRGEVEGNRIYEHSSNFNGQTENIHDYTLQGGKLVGKMTEKDNFNGTILEFSCTLEKQ